jgi:hypothetical protein
MEQERSQPVANATTSQTAQIGESRCRGLTRGTEALLLLLRAHRVAQTGVVDQPVICAT